jgi:hypothetical protein
VLSDGESASTEPTSGFKVNGGSVRQVEGTRHTAFGIGSERLRIRIVGNHQMVAVDEGPDWTTRSESHVAISRNTELSDNGPNCFAIVREHLPTAYRKTALRSAHLLNPVTMIDCRGRTASNRDHR